MIATFVRVRSWQWLLAGVLVGGLGTLSVGLWGEPLLSAYGESINGKRQFEEALTRAEGGRPWFTNLQVHAEELSAPAGGKRTVHVVSGMYYDGRSSAPGAAGKGGQMVWRPAFYVADAPYRSATDLRRRPGGMLAARRFESQARPTVMDFLDASDASYTHAWWRSPANARAAWLIVGVLGIGVAWPLTLNLIVFGSVRRPKEAGVDLRNVSRAPSPKPAADDAAMEQLDGVIDELLGSTSGEVAGVPRPEPVAPSAPPARVLETRPLEPVGAIASRNEKAFGAAEEDYYPTEIKAAKGKSTAAKKG